jgi:hypothetical protein
MKRLLIALVTLLATGSALAGTTIVEDFRGTVQTVTSTGTITLSLGATTTIVRVNTSSDVYIVGMSGGYDGRIVMFTNAGTANAYFYHESTSASSANERLMIDANTGYRIMYPGSNSTLGWAVYDATTSRWRFASIAGYNAGGSFAANGSIGATGGGTFGGDIATANATHSSTAGTRLTLKSLTSGNNGSNIKWQNSSAATLFTMGPDYNANGTNDWFLYDYTNGVTNLYANNTGTSYLAFGTSFGGLEYAESTDELRLFATGTVRLRLTDDWAKVSAPVFYQRQASGTAKPTLESATCGVGATQHADSTDSRGSVTIASGVTSCKMSFTVPWDIEQSPANGFPICTFTSSTGYVTVSALTDHYVTFVPSVSGAQTVYYHCDGVIDPP